MSVISRTIISNVMSKSDFSFIFKALKCLIINYLTIVMMNISELFFIDRYNQDCISIPIKDTSEYHVFSPNYPMGFLRLVQIHRRTTSNIR